MVQTRKMLARGVIGQVGDHQAVQFTMKYVGGGSVTSVIVTTATDITMISVANGVTYTDAYTWAAYGTVGAMVNAINAAGRFEAKILDALSTTVLANTLSIAGTLAVDANGNYNIMSDTTNQFHLAYRLTYDRTFGTNARLRNGHRVSIQEIVTDLTLTGGAEANLFKIYECTPGGNSAPYAGAEILVYQKTPVTGSVSTTNWASGQGKITASEGNDLLVIVSDGAGVTGTITVVGELE